MCTSKVFKTLVSLLFISFMIYVCSATSYAQTLYSCESPLGGVRPFLHIINPSTGSTLSTTEITLSGHTVRGCNGFARDPETNTCYMIISVQGTSGSPAPRLLTTIDVSTGVATEIGNTGLAFAGIAFTPDGTLYGLTGDQNGLALPTIYTINKNTGVPTEFLPLASEDDGEALGSNLNNGLLYRMDGRPPVFQNFQSINPANKNVSQIDLLGPATLGETTAITFLSGNEMLATDTNEDLYTLTTGGVVNIIGPMDHISKGLAFDCQIEPSEVPTISEWGLIAMAGILGIACFIVIRRRNAVA